MAGKTRTKSEDMIHYDNEYVKALISASGYTQKECAAALGISASMLAYNLRSWAMPQETLKDIVYLCDGDMDSATGRAYMVAEQQVQEREKQDFSGLEQLQKEYEADMTDDDYKAQEEAKEEAEIEQYKRDRWKLPQATVEPRKIGLKALKEWACDKVTAGEYTVDIFEVLAAIRKAEEHDRV